MSKANDSTPSNTTYFLILLGLFLIFVTSGYTNRNHDQALDVFCDGRILRTNVDGTALPVLDKYGKSVGCTLDSDR